MTEQEALLQAVLDNPEDTAVRLVYADFLEEAGDLARSEFIRVQCEAAEIEAVTENYDDCCCMLPSCLVCAKLRPLRRREKELLAHHAFDWLMGMRGLAAHHDPGHAEYGWLIKRMGEGARRIPAEFRRGFVEEISIKFIDWWGPGSLEGYGKMLVRSCPLTKVQFTDKNPSAWYPHSQNPEGWFWYLGGQDPNFHYEHHLPRTLFDLLESKEHVYFTTDSGYARNNTRFYHDKEAAVADLSRAALLHARRKILEPA